MEQLPAEWTSRVEKRVMELTDEREVGRLEPSHEFPVVT